MTIVSAHGGAAAGYIMYRSYVSAVKGVAVLGGEHTTTSTTIAYEILPHLLSRSFPGRDENLLNAFRARSGFDRLLAMRGCTGHDDGHAAAPRRTRSHRKAEPTDTPPLKIGVAESSAQLTASDKLIRERYEWRGYRVESSEPEEPPEQQTDSQYNVTFFAMVQTTVVGTITLRLDGPKGLRADATHGDITQYARADGRRLGELTRLALAEGTDSRLVLSSLFGLVYAVGRWVHNVTDVFIEVNPRHVAFYARALGFAIVGDVKFCERVRAPSMLLYADVDSLEERLGLAASAAAQALDSARRANAA
jgi:hypothetical protein